MKAFTVRMEDDALHENLSKRARLNHRSLSAETVHLVKWAMEQKSAIIHSEQDRVAASVASGLGATAEPPNTSG